MILYNIEILEVKYTNMDIIEVEELNVPGLYYVEDIKEDTKYIISELDKREWSALSNSKNSRVVQHYGYKYNYSTYNITEKTQDIPEFLNVLKNILIDVCSELELIDDTYNFNQCIVNNYNEGQGISPHIDVKSFGPVIGCFTLGSGCSMVFTNKDNKEEIYVNDGSLYIMSDDSRYKWKHSMQSRIFDIVNKKKVKRGRRISVTFRCVPT